MTTEKPASVLVGRNGRRPDDPTAGYLPTDDEWAELSSIAEALHDDGYAWFSLGNRWSKGQDGSVRTLLNGSHVMGSQRLSRQPFGWFTLDELRREVFADGCR